MYLATRCSNQSGRLS